MTENPIVALTKQTEIIAYESEEDDSLDIIVPTNPLIGAGGLIENLSVPQQRFLIAKMYGVTDAAAARASGVNYNTCQGWKRDNPNYAEVYRRVTEAPIEMAASASAFAFAKGMHKLINMLDHPKVEVVQWAIDRLISIGGLNKLKIEVEEKNGVGDVDAIIEQYERRKRERTVDVGDSTGDDSV